MLWRRDVRPQLQSESAECGLACLAMILDYHGFHTDVSALRRHFPVSTLGQSIRSLAEIADKFHLAARPVRLGLSSLPDLRLPAILHWNFNHFVVISRLRGSGAVILDPAVGEMLVPYEELSLRFTGVALELTPLPDFQTGSFGSGISFRWLLSSFAPSLSVSLAIFSLTLVAQLMATAIPFGVRGLIDAGIGLGSVSLAAAAVAVVLMLYIASSVSRISRDLAVFHATRAFHLDFGNSLFRHLISLPLSWFEKRSSTGIASKFEAIRDLRNLVTTVFAGMFLDGVFSMIIIALAFYIDSVLTAILCGAFLITLAIRAFSMRHQIYDQAELIEAESKMSGHFLESVRGMSTIKLSGIESSRHLGWNNLFHSVISRQRKIVRRDSFQSFAESLVRGSEHCLILYFGVVFIIRGDLSFGSLVAILAYRQLFHDRTLPLLDTIRDIRFAKLHLARLADIASADPEPRRGDLGIERAPLAGRVDLEEVSFRYGRESPWILRDCSISLRPGDFTAVIGPSGFGKTTLVKLLLGLLQPVEGRITADGTPIGDYGISDIRAQVGAVMQDDILLKGSILENISRFETDYSFEQVVRCAKLALIDDYVESLPMKYETMVGELGSSLSGGQRQRIMLARALYRNPQLLILDEGTANLDSATEKSILAELKGLDIGVIAVTHRAAVMDFADRVLFVRDGKISELSLAAAARHWKNGQDDVTGSAFTIERSRNGGRD